MKSHTRPKSHAHRTLPPSRRPQPVSASKSNPKRMHWCCRCLLSCIASVVLLLVITLLRSDSISPVAYELPEPPQQVGPLTPNEVLKNAEVLFKHKIKGPESIVVHDGNMYTGTLFGKIIKVDKEGSLSTFARLGKENCSAFWTCGRPLGMRLDKSKEFIYVVDGYLGVFKINLKTAKHERVFPFDDSFKVTFFDDLDILPNGDLIISEASTKYPFHKLMAEALECGSNGRLIYVNLKARTHEILATNLFFPNGVQLELKGSGADAVLVTESWRNRIWRISLLGERRGQKEIFADNLPGLPDNIRPSEARDGYWVAFGAIRTKEFTSNLYSMNNYPFLRSLIYKIVPFPLIHHMARSRFGLAVRLDLEGRITGALMDTNGTTIRDLSEVREHGGVLYLGNYDSPYLGRLDQSCKSKDSCPYSKLT